MLTARPFLRGWCRLGSSPVNRILCVEDGLDTIEILEATLRGYDLRIARSLAEAERILSGSPRFQLILLDIELPDGSGLDLFGRQTAVFDEVPVILLTGKTDLTWKAAAFALGAEDYIEKPFQPAELKLRVEARLRRDQRRRNFQIGSLLCSLDEHRLLKGPARELVDLTSIEFRIFLLLARTPQKIFSRSEILDRAWGDHVAVTERAVDVHVSNLRKKLEGSGVAIEAVVGTGYRLILSDSRRQTEFDLS